MDYFFQGVSVVVLRQAGRKKHRDGEGSYRETVDGWQNTDIKGTKLTTDKISGNLLKMQRFQVTICGLKAFHYLVRKINAQLLPEVKEAEQAKKEMVEKMIPLMRLLTWQDFELLVDLVFANSGRIRRSVTGNPYPPPSTVSQPLAVM